MTPTDAQPQGILSRETVLGHRSLLARLPGSALSALMKIGPGWSLLPDGGAVLRPAPKAWEHPVKDVYWLPCNPVDILRVAAAMAGEQHEASLFYAPWRSQEEPYTAGVVGGRWPNERQTRDIGRFADAHEAALAVLLDVCGGEE